MFNCIIYKFNNNYIIIIYKIVYIMSHSNKLIDRYLKKENLIDYYITNRICMLVNNPIDFKNIKSNLYFLGYTNYLGKNSINILLENKKYKIIEKLIKYNINILLFNDAFERNLLNDLLLHNYFYDFINDNYLKEVVLKQKSIIRF